MPKYKTHELYNGDVIIQFNENNHSYWTNHPTDVKKDGTPKMMRLTGVTTFCGIVDKSQALIPWAVNTTVDFIKENIEELRKRSGNEILSLARNEANKQRDLAAEIGSAIHLWIEEHIKGQLPEMPEDPQVLEGVNNFLGWVNENNVKFIWSEKVVYSKKYGFVGTADIGVEIDDKKYLLDIKTGNALYPEVKMQTAAYLMAEIEESGENYAGRYALRISKETEEEYNARMSKKRSNFPPFKIFEALYLDEDEAALEKDFEGFLSAMRLKQWNNYAVKEMYSLKG